MLKKYIEKINLIVENLYDYSDMVHMCKFLDHMITYPENPSNEKINFNNIFNNILNNITEDSMEKIKINPGIDQMYQYMSYGGNCIVFRNNTHVLKICKQTKTIYESFLDYSNNLPHSLSYSFLATVEIVIYADDNYIVYIQKFCEPVTEMNIEILFVIIQAYYLMIYNGIIFQDIYFRNFGYVDDRLMLFDYHYLPVSYPDIGDITNMILNILYTFKGKHYDRFCDEGFRYDYQYYVDNEFEIPNVPSCVSEYLQVLNLIMEHHNAISPFEKDDLLKKLKSIIENMKLILPKIDITKN